MTFMINSLELFTFNCAVHNKLRRHSGNLHVLQSHLLRQKGSLYKNNKTNSVALSPQANSTDWATATCRWNLVPTFADRGMSRGQHGVSPAVVNLSFLDRSRYFFFQVAPHLSSQGLSGPRSRSTATQKIWQRRESNPEPMGLQPGSLTTRPQRWSGFVIWM
jgi:hypothetical protein